MAVKQQTQNEMMKKLGIDKMESVTDPLTGEPEKMPEGPSEPGTGFVTIPTKGMEPEQPFIKTVVAPVPPAPVAANGHTDDTVLRIKASRAVKNGVLDFDDGKPLPFQITKMNGTQRAKWMDFQSKRMVIEGDTARIVDFDKFYETLISMCVTYGPGAGEKGWKDNDGRPLDYRLMEMSFILSWPGDAIFDVYDEAQKLNRLGQYTAPAKGNE